MKLGDTEGLAGTAHLVAPVILHLFLAWGYIMDEEWTGLR